jgi:hypothetical protein
MHRSQLQQTANASLVAICEGQENVGVRSKESATKFKAFNTFYNYKYYLQVISFKFNVCNNLECDFTNGFKFL